MTKIPHDGQDGQGQDNAASRRDVIKGVAGLAGAAAIGSSLSITRSEAAALPAPATSGIDHIVVLMQENRSFDHMLGWVPGANGSPGGRNFVDNAGNTFTSQPLTHFQNCSSHDPSHSFNGGRTQRAGGAMNGFLKTAPVGDQFPIGYHGPSDVQFFAHAARYWTICDNYFCGILGPTFPNRFYMHSGQTDRLSNTASLSQLPTIWDLAAAAGVSGRYYFQDSAFTALWGGKYASISLPFSQFLADAAAGTLPAISYIDPRFVNEGLGTSTDDHPLADIRNGQVLMNEIYTALTTSPNWPNTLFIINYDEWGGFADHVAPAMAPVSAAEATVGNVDATDPITGPAAYLGFRVPCVLIGPRARRGSVAHGIYDPNAILNLISWRFGLPGIGVRATTSGNIANALNFSGPPNIGVPPAITGLLPFNPAGATYGQSCAVNPMANLEEIYEGHGEHLAEVEELRRLTIASGFRTV
jgi:phospholipase C